MIEINFMPWRQQQKQYAQAKARNTLIAAGCVALAFVGTLHLTLNYQENRLHRELAILKQKILQYPQDLHLSKTASPVAVSEKLARSLNLANGSVVELFHLLGQIQQTGICFTHITRQQNKILFTGQAASAMELTDFIMHWNMTNLFSEIYIHQIEESADQPLAFQFQAIEK